MGDREHAEERLIRDMRDLADAKRKQAEVLERLADKMEAGEEDLRVVAREVKHRQIMLDVPV